MTPLAVSLVGDRVEYLPPPNRGVDGIIHDVAEAVAECRRRGLKKLLVRAGHVTVPSGPTTLDRFKAVTAWAHAAGADIRLAIVVNEATRDPSGFDVRLASTLGSDLKVFASDAEALSWLEHAA